MNPVVEKLRDIMAQMRGPDLPESEDLFRMANALERIADHVEDLQERNVSFLDQLLNAQRRLHSLDIDMPWECYWFGHSGDQTESGYHVCDRCGLHAGLDPDIYYSVSAVAAVLIHWPKHLVHQIQDSRLAWSCWVDDVKFCAKDFVFGSRHPEARFDLEYHFKTRVLDPPEQLFRKFVPRPCPDCGRRWRKCSDNCIPF